MERALFYSAIRACWFHGIVLTNRPVKLPGIRKWFALRGEGRRTPSLELNRNSVRYIDRQKDFQHLFFCQAKHRGTDVAETLVNGGHRKTFLLLRDSIFLRLRKHHLCAWVLDRSNNSSKKKILMTHCTSIIVDVRLVSIFREIRSFSWNLRLGKSETIQ